jgi:DNA-binding MarR family transcriptional regulator
LDNDLKSEVIRTVFRLRKLHGPGHHDHSLNLSSIAILRIIEREGSTGEHPDFSTIIQERLHISKPAVSMQFKVLERKGLIEREVNPDDLRRFDVTLTEKGRRQARHLCEVVDARIEQVIKKMGERDLRELLRLVNRFIDLMSEPLEHTREHKREHKRVRPFCVPDESAPAAASPGQKADDA